MVIKEIPERVKNILIHPKKEWEFIQYEQSTPRELILQYVLPITIIAAIATFIGLGFFGYHNHSTSAGGFGTGLTSGINLILEDVVTIIIGGWLIDALAPYHQAEKKVETSIQLMAYSYTPVMIGSFLNVIPALTIVGNLFGLYSIPLLYWGASPMKNVPENKKLVYVILIIFGVFIIRFLIGYLLNGMFSNPYLPSFHETNNSSGVFYST